MAGNQGLRRTPMNESSKTESKVGIVNDTLSSRSGDELLTVQQAARVLNVSVSWVYEHTREDADGRLPCLKLGKYVRFDQRDLHAYIDAKRAASRRQPRRG